MRTKKALLVSD